MTIRTSVAILSVLAMAACGGGSRYSSANAQGGGGFGSVSPIIGGAILPFATGPIYSACQSGNRKAATRARCGCVQAVADQELSSADQRRATRYFKDPHKLQEVRQSDNAGNERFWLAWKAYGQRAAEVCQGS